MNIQTLIEKLQNTLDSGANLSTDTVVFRNQKGELIEIDYLLTNVDKNTLTLCWDDGIW